MKGRPKPHIVEWIDSCSGSQWTDIDRVRTWKATTVTSVGFLIEKTSEKVVLSLNYDSPNNNVADSIVIPRSAVKKIRRLYTK